MFDIECSKVLDAAFDARKHAKCALCAFHDNVRKNAGAVFLEGPKGPSVFPNASTKLLYHLGKLKSLTNAVPG